MAEDPSTEVEPEFGLRELGTTGLKRSSGYVYEEFLRQLQGPRAISIYREMASNDPVVGAILFAIDMLIRQVEWSVESADDSQAAQEQKEFLEECMQDMSHTWTDFVSEVMSMLPFGWSYFEQVYKRRDGDASRYDDQKIGWRKFAVRAQDSLDRWEFDTDGGLRGMWQRVQYGDEAGTQVFIPIEKALLFRTISRKGNPEGVSSLRNAYRPWYFKKRIEEIEGIGIERDLAGLPYAQIPVRYFTSPKPEDVAILEEIKQLVINVRRDEQEGVVLPMAYDDRGNKLFEFGLLNSGGTRQFNTDAVIARYDQRIAMTVLADFILLGHEAVGSFALSSDKTNLFAVAIGAWLTSICETLNRHAVARIMEINQVPREQWPEITYEDIEKQSLVELGQFIVQLTGAGVPMFPDERLEEHLRNVAGLPGKSDEAKQQQDQDQEQQRQQQMITQRTAEAQLAMHEAKHGTPGVGQNGSKPPREREARLRGPGAS